MKKKALLKEDITGPIISKLSISGNDIYLEELEDLFNSDKSPEWNKINRFLDTIPPEILKAHASCWIEVNDGRSEIPEKWWLFANLIPLMFVQNIALHASRFILKITNPAHGR